MPFDIEQHNREILENRQHWDRKPLLRRIYAGFYREIAARIDRSIPGAIIELGSGMANIKEHVPDCITTDIFPNPWLDCVVNAYALSFADGAIGHIILFDVWHHLEHPGAALREFYRALSPNGKLILFEPAMGLFGRIVFGLFHHEPLALKDPIQWDAPAGFNSAEQRYYAAQGNASRVFGARAFEAQLSDWRIEERRYFSALAYLASGGLRGPQLYPAACLPVLEGIDAALSPLSFLSSRMLVILRKR